MPLQSKTVLLAEDEEHLRTIIAMMIEELGAQVITVSDGRSALEEYRKSTSAVDLVLMDMRMKNTSGDIAFRRLLEIDPNVKVVLFSGVSPDKSLLDLLRLHRCGFIEKPFNLSTLSKTLRSVIDGEPHISVS